MLYKFSIFLSALLLFQIQPIASKALLPYFGGASSVWLTCLFFFQAILFVGYWYADRLQKLRPRVQVILHILLLVGAIAILPISFKAGRSNELKALAPQYEVFLLLLTSVGLPYLILSSTSPLWQAWSNRYLKNRYPYYLFSLSNAASLLGLLLYPFLIERYTSLESQTFFWSVGFALFAFIGILQSVHISKYTTAEQQTNADEAERPKRIEVVLWFMLSFSGSLLLLAVSNHITQEIAPIPLLWVIPLTLYLLTFILVFAKKQIYSKRVCIYSSLPLMFLAASRPEWLSISAPLQVAIQCVVLFLFCMLCHGELAKRAPAPQFLTQFYLVTSFAGMIAGLFVAFLAPVIFTGYVEYPFAFHCAIISLIAVMLTNDRIVDRHPLPSALALIALTLGSLWLNIFVVEYSADDIERVRNFYGVVAIKEQQLPDGSMVRKMAHGATEHGVQLIDEANTKIPTAYYGKESGIGSLLSNLGGTDRSIGVIGLGAGTLATYGRSGDTFVFYEINPSVIELAQSYFSFLKDSAAKVELVEGDGRLMLEADSRQFDVILVDAFSSDAIPVHLLTKEAFAIYLSHLRQDGVLAFHISNKRLDLKPVLAKIAQGYGLSMTFTDTTGSALPVEEYASIYALFSRENQFQRLVKGAVPSEDITPAEQEWTDSYSNILRFLH